MHRNSFMAEGKPQQSVFIPNGHTMFEVNYETGKIVPAEMYIHEETKKKSINKKENCFYLSALNLKNAYKRANKMILTMANHISQMPDEKEILDTVADSGNNDIEPTDSKE